MKIFAIRSDSNRKAKDLAYLIYYEEEKTFYIEIPEDADEWELPLILSSFLKRGERTVNAYYSRMWVQQRIVPPDRQNLGQILKENNLDDYDEFKLLMLSKGRCAQDDYYLYPISSDKLPENFSIRLGRRVKDVVPLHGGNLLVFFGNGEVKKCNVNELIDKARCASLLANYERFCTVELLIDGHGVSWGTVLTISNETLYVIGKEIDLSIDDFKCFVSSRVINVAEACEILDCSRQNIHDLIKRGRLTPLKYGEQNSLLMKNEVIQRKW